MRRAIGTILSLGLLALTTESVELLTTLTWAEGSNSDYDLHMKAFHNDGDYSSCCVKDKTGASYCCDFGTSGPDVTTGGTEWISINITESSSYDKIVFYVHNVHGLHFWNADAYFTVTQDTQSKLIPIFQGNQEYFTLACLDPAIGFDSLSYIESYANTYGDMLQMGRQCQPVREVA